MFSTTTLRRLPHPHYHCSCLYTLPSESQAPIFIFIPFPLLLNQTSYSPSLVLYCRAHGRKIAPLLAVHGNCHPFYNALACRRFGLRTMKPLVRFHYLFPSRYIRLFFLTLMPHPPPPFVFPSYYRIIVHLPPLSCSFFLPVV